MLGALAGFSNRNVAALHEDSSTDMTTKLPLEMVPPSGRVLIIAGSDSGGGAGIQGDIKTVQALGGYAMTAITAVTVQNTLGVSAVHPVPPKIVADQIAVCLSDIGADIVKIGMLGDAEVIGAVAAVLRGARLPVVLDPVGAGATPYRNAALLAASILALSDPAVDAALTAWRARQTAEVAEVPEDAPAGEP